MQRLRVKLVSFLIETLTSSAMQSHDIGTLTST